MVQRRDLNAPPGRRLADVIRAAREEAQASKTGEAGVTDLGPGGDTVWPDPETGAPVSVRDLPPRIDATAEAIDEAKTDLEAAEGAIAEAKQAIVDEAAARADALEAARVQITAEITASANGKNSMTASADAPSLSTPGGVAGDMWWQVDGDGVIFGQWRWTGSDWSPATIRSEVIASLDVGRLVVAGESRFTSAVVDRLFADLFTAHKITAAEVTIAALDENGEIAPGSVRGVMIGDGEVSANKITIVGDPDDPDEVGLIANIASIMRLAVENLTVTDGATIDDAVILKLAAEMITSGVLRTAETGQRVVIDGAGIVMYGVDPDGLEYELVRIGPSGANLLTIGQSTISEDAVGAPSGDFERLSIGGESVHELLDLLPRGIVAWQSMTRLSAWHGDPGTEAYRVSVSATLAPGRLYRVQVAAHYVQARSGTARVEEYIRYVEGTRSGRPGTSADQLISGRTFGVGTTASTVPPIAGIYSTASRTSDLDITFMLQQRGYGTDIRYVGSDSVPLVMTVEDLGPARGESGTDWANVGTPASTGTSPEAPPAKPEKTRYTTTWDAGGYGGDTSAGDVVQGYYSGVGMRSGGWVFPSAMRSALAGAEIDKFEVYLYASHWYWGSGGTASIRPNNGSYSGWVGSAFTSANWPRNAGRWVTVPSSWHSAIAAGTYRGVGVQTSSTNSLYYGRFRGTSAKFRATYRK